jgi:hypothetical protein
MMTPNSLIVTTSWDDGTVTDIRLAGLLEKYGLAGTFYVPKFMEDALPRQDIVALGEKFEIGAHSLTQPDLTRIPLTEAEREIKESKHYLEDLMGHAVRVRCRPDRRAGRAGPARRTLRLAYYPGGLQRLPPHGAENLLGVSSLESGGAPGLGEAGQGAVRYCPEGGWGVPHLRAFCGVREKERMGQAGEGLRLYLRKGRG